MDSNHDSAANRPTQQFRPAGTPGPGGPGRPGPGPAAPGAGGRPPRGGRAIRWTAGLAAAAVLVGGLAVLALLEALAQRLSVVELLRQVTSRRGDWKSGLID
ncbi:MAG TPA: hypothetical protein VGH88_17150, partial [Streptosporangiaceae bacterium]